MKQNRTIIPLLLITCLHTGFSIVQKNFEQTGIASYYSDAFHGRKTASGEIYDKNLFTAAHATLPFFTMVKVTNLKNNKTVIVKINDRSPKYNKRMIDLSKAAAIKLDMIKDGIVNAKLEVINPSDTKTQKTTADSLVK